MLKQPRECVWSKCCRIDRDGRDILLVILIEFLTSYPRHCVFTESRNEWVNIRHLNNSLYLDRFSFPCLAQSLRRNGRVFPSPYQEVEQDSWSRHRRGGFVWCLRCWLGSAWMIGKERTQLSRSRPGAEIRPARSSGVIAQPLDPSLTTAHPRTALSTIKTIA